MAAFKKIKSSQTYFNFFFCALGCALCFYLQELYHLPNFLSSVLVGLAGSFLPHTKYYNAEKGIASIYTGSFASMCSLAYFNSTLDLLLLCLIVGLYFNLLSPYFRGMGGKLGSIGFLSSLSFVLLRGIH